MSLMVNIVVVGILVGGGLLNIADYGNGAGVSAAPCYPALFVFGDSLSDTGNGVLSGNPLFTRIAQLPYGETVPGFPFNRFSDGLLLVDRLAIRVGLPPLNPSLNSSADFRKGVNYAVSSATALDPAYLRSKFIVPLTNLSLDVQITWHPALKASGPSPQKPGPIEYGMGLYVIEIGENDYTRAINANIYSPSYIVKKFVPLIISKIRNATEVLYGSGGRNFVYFSVKPLGCSPSLLAQFPFSTAKDSNGCLRHVNTISYSHGVNLLNLVKDLRTIHPDAHFTFVDYYGSFTQVIGNSSSYGFSNTLDACCGAGPLFSYRYENQLFCNSLSNTFLATLCPNPNTYLSWDGIHSTNRFNSLIFNLTIERGSYLDPPNAFTTCTPTTP